MTHMKQQLRQIYEDLSSRKLSQKEALEKIKAVKLQGQDKSSGVLLLTPVWQAGGAEALHVDYAEHRVVLCELSNVNVGALGALLPHSQCLQLEAGSHESIANRYCERAIECHERIQTILQNKPQGKALFQIVAADHQEQALFAGLSGLLKTAVMENPRFVGQVILIPSHTTAEELARLLQAEKSRALDPLI